MARKLRIFISSPGDVGQERILASRVIERLQGEFARYIELDPVLWEHEPLRATSHFASEIPLPSETDIVISILWSRLGTRLPENFRREDGTTYSSGTEFEFEDAVRAYKVKGVPDLLVYRKMAEVPLIFSDESLLLEKLEQKKALDKFIDRWFGSPGEGFKAAFHSFHSPDEFENNLEKHLRRLIQDHIPENPVTIPIKRWFKDPYRGLEAFAFQHAPVFFGRTRAISEIKDRMVSQSVNGKPFIIVYGMSGCGKSSVVSAGLLPTITQPGVIEGIGLWRWGVFRPSDSSGDLFEGLASALLASKALPEIAQDKPGLKELPALFRLDPGKAAGYVCEILRQIAAQEKEKDGLKKIPEIRLALVIDQMEELFTLDKVTAGERENFVRVLSALAKSGMVWIIATMRSDFYHRGAEIPEFVRLSEGGEYTLLKPESIEISQMIRYPSQAAGLSFEINPQNGERLDDVLHAAAAKDTSSLPLLEFTLEELYKHRLTKPTGEEILTFKAYRELGGLEGALAQRAEAVLAGLPLPAQAEFPAVFRSLVAADPNSGDIITARRVALETLAQTPERRQLVDAFDKARLMVSDRGDDGRVVVRVAHEALLHSWPRFKKMLDEDRDFLRTRDRVANSTLRWTDEARKKDFLLQEGKPLAEAEEILKIRRGELDRNLVEYIEASIKKAARARRIKRFLTVAAFTVVLAFGITSFLQLQEVNKQKAYALEQKGVAEKQTGIALANEKKANENAAEARKQTNIARQEKQRAEQNATEAKKQKGIAEEQTALALEQKSYAESQTAIAVEQRSIADEQRHIAVEKRDEALRNESLMMAALSKRETDDGNRMGALKLALNALPRNIADPDRPYVPEAESALYYALNNKEFQGRAVYKGPRGSVKSVLFSRDGKRILALSADRTVRIWDIKTGQQVLLLDKFEGSLDYAEFSPNGKRLLTISSDGRTVKIWDIETGNLYWTLTLGEYNINSRSAVFSPDGQFLLTSSRDSKKLWDIETRKELFEIKNKNQLEDYISFEPTGKRFLTASQSGEGVKVYDVKSGNLITGLKSRYGQNSATFSPDGSRIMTVLPYVHLWDAKTGNQLLELKDSANIDEAVFSPDSKLIATVSYGNGIKLWEAGTGKELFVLGKPGVPGYHAVFSPDGKLIVTVDEDKGAHVWDVKTGKEASLLDKHKFPVTDAGFSPDGRFVFTASADKTVRLWDIMAGKEVIKLNEYNGILQHQKFFYPLKSGATLLGNNTDRLSTNLATSPDGYNAALGFSDGRINIWNVNTSQSQVEARLEMWHFSKVAKLVFSPDGRHLLSASWDHTARIWDVETGHEVAVLEHINPVYNAEFSTDGKKIVTLSTDNTVRVWNAKTGEELMVLDSQGTEITDAGFGSDGKSVAALLDNGSAIVGRLFADSQELIDYARTIVGDN